MLQIAFPETELNGIVAKVERGERLSVDDGVRLYESSDLMMVGMLADRVRRIG
jgi:aminodeoxyfutalosine synthase